MTRELHPENVCVKTYGSNAFECFFQCTVQLAKQVAILPTTEIVSEENGFFFFRQTAQRYIHSFIKSGIKNSV